MIVVDLEVCLTVKEITNSPTIVIVVFYHVLARHNIVTSVIGCVNRWKGEMRGRAIHIRDIRILAGYTAWLGSLPTQICYWLTLIV